MLLSIIIIYYCNSYKTITKIVEQNDALSIKTTQKVMGDQRVKPI